MKIIHATGKEPLHFECDICGFKHVEPHEVARDESECMIKRRQKAIENNLHNIAERGHAAWEDVRSDFMPDNEFLEPPAPGVEHYDYDETASNINEMHAFTITRAVQVWRWKSVTYHRINRHTTG